MKPFKMKAQWLFISIFVLATVAPAANAGDEITFVMCRPALSQIKNIEQLYEKDLITLDRIKLIGVFHEDESTDYTPAKEYVAENKLLWVSFETIKGTVPLENLFKQNQWTDQFRAIFNRTQGIIFTGGLDIPPVVFGEEDLLLTEATTPKRTFYELSFLFHLIGGSQDPQFVPFLETRKNYVVLGICLGAQTMNVAAGGSLYQDIPSQVYGLKTVQQVLRLGRERIHSSRYIKALHPLEQDLPPAFHRIKLKKDSIWIKRMGMRKNDTPYILTSHHQTLKKLGKDLKVNATSMDGKIIEGVEHKRYKNVLGVQFHPEYYPLYQKGRYYRGNPGEELNFNLRLFLINHPPAMAFHKALWQWFSDALRD